MTAKNAQRLSRTSKKGLLLSEEEIQICSLISNAAKSKKYFIYVESISQELISILLDRGFRVEFNAKTKLTRISWFKSSKK